MPDEIYCQIYDENLGDADDPNLVVNPIERNYIRKSLIL